MMVCSKHHRMLTDNRIHRERDLAIKGHGGLSIVFERCYNSQGAKDGPLGFGWTHSFNHFIRSDGVEGAVGQLREAGTRQSTLKW